MFWFFKKFRWKLAVETKMENSLWEKPALTETKKAMKSLKKDNLKKFLARRRWQRGAHAVLAIKRIVSATSRSLEVSSDSDSWRDFNSKVA